MSILITGSSGFIGKRFVRLLQSKNISHRTIGRRITDDFLCDFETDIIDPEVFQGIDCIVHIAGYAHDYGNRGRNSDKHEILNFQLTADLLKLADQYGVEKFIYISSVKAGGKHKRNGKITEDASEFSYGNYSKSKRKSETFLLNYEPVNFVKKVIIRPSLVYGENMGGNLNLMLSFIKKGIFPPLPHTSSRKALIHVDDVARSIYFLIQKKNLDNEIFCISDGNFYSPRDIFNSLLRSLDKEPKNWHVPFFIFKLISYIPYFKGIIKKIFEDEPYSSDKIKSLGFQPLFELEQINEKAF